jgi:hypothetical protein
MYVTRLATIQAGDHVKINCLLISFVIRNSVWVSICLNGVGILALNNFAHFENRQVHGNNQAANKHA